MRQTISAYRQANNSQKSEVVRRRLMRYLVFYGDFETAETEIKQSLNSLMIGASLDNDIDEADRVVFNVISIAMLCRLAARLKAASKVSVDDAIAEYKEMSPEWVKSDDFEHLQVRVHCIYM